MAARVTVRNDHLDREVTVTARQAAVMAESGWQPTNLPPVEEAPTDNDRMQPTEAARQED